MCTKIAHPGGCWIFRIQVGEFRRDLDPRRSYVYIFSLCYSSILVAKFINLPGKIQNLGAKIFWRPKSKIAAHNKVEIQFWIDSENSC